MYGFKVRKQTIEEEKYSELLRDSYHFIELITKLCEKKIFGGFRRKRS